MEEVDQNRRVEVQAHDRALPSKPNQKKVKPRVDISVHFPIDPAYRCDAVGFVMVQAWLSHLVSEEEATVQTASGYRVHFKDIVRAQLIAFAWNNGFQPEDKL